MENGFVRHVVPVVETELQGPRLALVTSDASQGSWTRLMALRSRPLQRRLQNFNAGPLLMSVTDVGASYSRGCSHRYVDQGTGNGHGQRQSRSRGHFGISFCCPHRM